MRKVLKLTLALTTLATASLGLFPPKRAEAACPTYCCPGTTRCITCCTRTCDLNCP